MPTIGIIGGGVSGCVVLGQLVTRIIRDGVENCKIHIWEREAELGPGLAWSEKCSDAQIFNIPAGAASVVHGEWDSYMKYLQSQHVSDVPFFSYPPRRQFGPYIKDVVNRSLSLAEESGIRVLVHTSSEVTRLTKLDSPSVTMSVGYIAAERSLVVTDIDCVFLCSGPPSYTPRNYPHLLGMEGYIASPWPYTALSAIPPDVAVGVVGTGLTAVDVVKQLQAQGHKGKIYMTSRRGVLPTIKATVANPFRPLTHATLAGVQSIMDARGGPGSRGLLPAYLSLIAQEVGLFNDDYKKELAATAAVPATMVELQSIVSEIDTNTSTERIATTSSDDDVTSSRINDICFANAMRGGVRNGAEELRANLLLSRSSQRIPYQDCIIALEIQGVLRVMWSSLAPDEQGTFMSEYGTLFQVYTNSMPAASGEVVLDMIDSGQCVVRGGLQNIQFAEGGSEDSFFMHFASSEPSDTIIPVRYVVNASGFETRYVASAEQGSSLYEGMMADGLLLPHAMGGLCADFRTCRVETVVAEEAVSSQPQIYAVGYPLKGVKLTVSGLSYCVQDAVAAVESMAWVK